MYLQSGMQKQNGEICHVITRTSGMCSILRNNEASFSRPGLSAFVVELTARHFFGSGILLKKIIDKSTFIEKHKYISSFLPLSA